LPRKKKSSSARLGYARYVVRVTGWDRFWSFSVNLDRRYERTPLSSASTLTLRGKVFRPSDFKCPDAEITLSGHAMDLEGEERRNSIGYVDVKSGLLRAYLFVPEPSMCELTTLAASDRLRLIHMVGGPLRYGSAIVFGVNLNTEFDEEEW